MNGELLANVPLVEIVKGNYKVPVSEGSNLAKTISINQIKQFIYNNLDYSDTITRIVSELLMDYALKSDIPDISNKQDKLVSGINIATINNKDITKGGNINTEDQNLKIQVDELNNLILDNITKISELENRIIKLENNKPNPEPVVRILGGGGANNAIFTSIIGGGGASEEDFNKIIGGGDSSDLFN